MYIDHKYLIKLFYPNILLICTTFDSNVSQVSKPKI